MRRSSSGVGICVVMVALLAVVAPAAAQPLVVPSTDIGSLRQALFGAIANEVGALPQPQGVGFTYQFDPALGVFSRANEGFGPVFAQRAETIGRGRLTLTTSYTLHTFDEIDGRNLRDGEPVGFVLGFDSGVRINFLDFKEEVDADVFTLGALYGVTDQIDIGLTIPIVHVKVRESPRRFAFADCGIPIDPSRCNVFLTDDRLIPQKAENTDLGDVVLRAKYNFWRNRELMGGRAGVAAALDVKLPTGDKGERRKFTDAELVVPPSGRVSESFFAIGDPPTGTGIVRVRPQLIASGTWFGVSPHLTVGAELGKTQGVTNDLIYEAGLDYTLFQRVTFSADLLARHAFGVDRRRVTTFGVGKTANPDTLTGSFGVKVNPVGSLLVFLNVLVPLNETGVRDDLTPTFGLEWTY